MRKNFLILMLLSLLPLAGWATDITGGSGWVAPSVNSGLKWTGSDLPLVVAPTLPEGFDNTVGHVYYLVKDNNTAPLKSNPNWGQADQLPKASAKGTYYVFWYATNDGTVAYNEDTDVMGPLTVEIALGVNEFTTALNITGWTYGDYSAETNAPTSQVLYGEVIYEYKLASAGDDTYTATVPENAGDYKVRASVPARDNCYDAISDTKDFTIAKAAAGLDANNIQINGAAVGSYKYSDALSLVASYNGEPATTAEPYFRFSNDGGSTWVENPVIAKGENWRVGCGALEAANHHPAFVMKAFTITAGDQDWATPLSVEESYIFGNVPEFNLPVAKYESAAVTLSYYDQADPTTPLGSAPTTSGSYTVKAIAAETANYSPLEASANYTILPAASAVATAPTPKTGLTYDGTAQPLLTAGTATNGTMQYKVGEGDWSDVVPTATNAGSYTISYKVKGDTNYKDIEEKSLGTITIEKINLNYALGNQTSEYTGEEILPNGNYAKMAGNFAAGENLSTVATFSFGDEPTDVADSKTYNALEVNYLNGSEQNYNITFTGSSILTITPKAFSDAMISGFTASTTWDNSVKTPGYTVADGEPSTLDAAKDVDVVITKAGAEVAASEVKAAGEYTYTFTPKNNYAGDAIEKVFTINGKALVESMLKTPATWSATADYSGADRKPATIVLKDGTTTLTGSDYEMVITNTKDENEDGKNDVVTAAINADTYTFTFTGKGNYTGSFTKTLTVNQVAATVTAPTAVAGLKYTSEAQTLINAGSATGGTIKYSLAEAGEYTTALPEGTNATTYTVWYKVEADADHSDVAPASINVTIDPALVLVSVKENISKDYDGTVAFGTQKPSLEYSGLKGSDTKSVITFNTTEVAAISAKDVEAAPGEYDLEVDLNQLHATNYTFAANAEITRTFTINATTLVINFANNKVDGKITDAYKKEYGTEDNFDAAWKTANIAVGGALDDTEKAAIIAGINVVREEVETVGTSRLSIVIAEPAADVFANYNAPATGNADFEITKATLQVALKEDLSKVYDGAAPEATFKPALADLAISGYKNNETSAVITTLPTATIVDAAKDQGTYTITLDGAEAQNYKFEYSDARYVITPRTLTATVNPQTVKVGADDEDLSQVAGVDYIINNAIQGDDLEASLSINGSTAVANEGIANGILLTVGNTNYTLAATYGKLIVTETGTILLSKTNDNTSVIVNANGATVTFDNFNLAADRWYAMVLPFETNPAKLSQAFGYAVVDTLDESNPSTTRVKFGLCMKKIPANKPFLIKLYEEKNMNAVTFTGVNLVKPANAAALTVTDAAGNQFIGTYAGVTIAAPDKDYIISISDGDIHPAAAGAKVRPLAAYIKTIEAYAAAPVFTIEEADGSTTEINAISINAAAENDGWYNVNGMKRGNAPVQKGVYIKNGKKVVVK